MMDAAVQVVAPTSGRAMVRPFSMTWTPDSLIYGLYFYVQNASITRLSSFVAVQCGSKG